jgi:hypothetical protein
MSFPFPNLPRLLGVCPRSDEFPREVPEVWKLTEGDADAGGFQEVTAVQTFDRFLSAHSYSIARHGPYYNPTTHAPNPSHNNLFGGMYKVEDSDPEVETEFHALLLAAIRAGGVYGLCENRTAYSALYFDLDFKGPPPVPSLQDLRSIVVMIREVLHRLGGELWRNESHAVVALSPEQTDTALNLVKLGAHIIFPNIVLGYDDLLRVNLTCRDHVENMLGVRRAPANTWTDVFDTTMYRTGLRMLFVDKNKRCEVCTATDSRSVASNTGSGSRAAHPPPPLHHKCTNGFVGQKRPYVPVLYWHSRVGEDFTMLTKLTRDPLFALHHCSIRRPHARKPYPSPPSFDSTCPSAMETHTSASGAKRELGKLAEGGGGAPPSAAAAASTAPKAVTAALASRAVFVEMSDSRILVLQGLVRRYEPRFSQVTVRSATLNAALTTYTVRVSGHGRHHCMNCPLDTPHSRSTVVFVVDLKNGVSQKCTSRSEKVESRVSGKPCRLFRSPWVQIEKSQKSLLFSGVKTQTSLELIIDNDNVYIPDWNIVEVPLPDSEHALAQPRSRTTAPLEFHDTFSPHRPEPSSAIRVLNATVLEKLELPCAPPLPAALTPAPLALSTTPRTSAAIAKFMPQTWKSSTRKRTTSGVAVIHPHAPADSPSGQLQSPIAPPIAPPITAASGPPQAPQPPQAPPAGSSSSSSSSSSAKRSRKG